MCTYNVHLCAPIMHTYVHLRKPMYTFVLCTPIMYTYTYDHIYGNFPAKNIVYTPGKRMYVWFSAKPSCAKSAIRPTVSCSSS